MDQNIPSTWKRMYAMWLDGLPMAIILVFATLPTLMQGYLHASWPVLIAGWSFMVLYHVCFLYYFGATPGKMLYGLRVISLSGDGSLSLRQAIVRSLIALIGSSVFSLLPQIVALFRLDRRQLADLAADTRVVQKTARQTPPHKRYILGTIFVFFALIGIVNTLANLSRYQISADGVTMDLFPGH